MTAKKFLIRAVTALLALVCFWAAPAVPALKWAGLILYLLCLAMFVRTLVPALFKARKITADVLIVTVMIVSLLDKNPLSGALVACFISTGLAVSFLIIERTRRKIDALTNETKKTVRVLRDGQVETVLVEQVVKDDIAIVPRGEMIPVDGVIVSGKALLDESVISGEPYPLCRSVGDPVTSGAIVLDSQLQIRALSDGDRSFIYAISKEIQQAMQNKPGIHRRADTVVQYFIGGVVLYAFGVYAFSGSLEHMAAVLAVACPCAWALSVPTAFAAAIGSLSSQGILVRGGRPLELLGRTRTVILDKTGTLTTARPDVESVSSTSMTPEQLVQLAASVETGFTHPIAEAIVDYASRNGIRPLEASRCEYLPGMGVSAEVAGHQVVIGSTSTMQSLDINLPAGMPTASRAVWVGVDREIGGVIGIGDRLRDHVDDLGRRLHDLGVEQVVLATGDNEAGEASRVAAIIAADENHCGLRPEDKLALVREHADQGVTLMVGDGINDAQSLSAAHIGMSLGGAQAELAIKSSDIISRTEDAGALLISIAKGKKLRRIITENYVWAMGFNVVGISLATAGLISPVWAALFHHLSSLLVVSNSARLVRNAPPAAGHAATDTPVLREEAA